jgi:hypothetical protein
MQAHAHAAAVERLPYVVALLGRAAAHRRRNAKLAVLCDAGEELAEALEARGGGRAVGLLLDRVRWLADDFAVPAWGDRAYQALMEELAALEADVRGWLDGEAVAPGRPDVEGPTARAA